MAKKLLVIGIDGVSWELIQPLVDQGAMPTLKGIIDKGTSGKLATVLPPDSSPAWPSFFTGKNPGKTGVFSFFKLLPDYSIRFPKSTDIKAESVWGMLSKKGFKCNVVNVPITFPPEKINGKMVSYVREFEAKGFVFPKELEAKVKEIKGNQGNEKTGYKKYAEKTGKIFEIFRLLDSNEWDFEMIVFLQSDSIQHEIKTGSEEMNRYFTYLDETIKRLVDSCTTDTTIMVLSDHGSTQAKKVFNVNNWLAQNNYLVLKENVNQRDWFFTALKRVGITRGSIYRLFKALGLKRAVSGIPQKMRKSLKEDHEETEVSFRNLVLKGAVDWENTKAFCYSSTGVHVNRKGAFEKGCVEAWKAQALAAELAGRLNKELGSKEFFLPKELYKGPYSGKSPDIVMESGRSPIYFSDKYSANGKLVGTPEKLIGLHTANGIYAIKGKGICRGKKADLSILDLARTMLHIFGVPSPQDLDGKLPGQIFEKKQEEKITGKAEHGSATEKLESALSSEDEEKIIESLKDLDYV